MTPNPRVAFVASTNLTASSDGPRPASVSQCVAHALVSHDVSRVFGLPGEQTGELLAAMDAVGIEFVLARHEQGAGFMANVASRIGRSTAVCVTTLGPGATNLLTPLADASLANVPMVAFVARPPQTVRHLRHHQQLELTRLLEPVAKVFRIDDPKVAQEISFRALDWAQTHQTPVVVELPADLTSECSVLTPVTIPDRERPAATRVDPRACDAATDLLASASRPAVIVGARAPADSAEPVSRLTRALGAGVATTFGARGIVPDEHPLSLGALSGDPREPTARAVQEADVVVAVGFDPIELAPAAFPHPRAATDPRRPSA